MSWKELVNKALTGTDRGQLPPSLIERLKAFGLPDELPPERLLLEGAAIFHLMNKAAVELEDYQGEVLMPENSARAEPCSAKSSYHLQLILDGPFRLALSEFVSLLKDSGKRLPPESLPFLFDQSLTDRRLWRQLGPAIGPVGEWLLRQNPEWDPLNQWAQPDDWEKGTARDRRRFLRRLHEYDPPEAIVCLRQTWPDEPYRSKLGFLEILETNPREADIGFLEDNLSDSRKEVRLASADILALHANAPLVERLFRRAAQHLKINTSRELEVSLPATLDEELQRQGIRENPKEKYHTSPRGRWLMQIVARVPPARWNSLFDRDAAGCLSLFAATDFRDSFLLALTQAVNRHGGADWMAALLDYWYESKEELHWENDAARGMMQQLPDALFNEHLLRYIEREGPAIRENSVPAQLLALAAHWWTERLTLLFIQGFQGWMSDASRLNQNTHYNQLLRAAAYRSNSNLLERLRKGWPMTARAWPQWQEEVEQFINIMHFRQKMKQELEKDHPPRPKKGQKEGRGRKDH